MSAGGAATLRASLDLGFLNVDAFLATLVDARVLKTAFELQLVDRLLAHETQTVVELGAGVDVDDNGLDLLLGLLAANSVVTRKGDR